MGGGGEFFCLEKRDSPKKPPRTGGVLSPPNEKLNVSREKAPENAKTPSNWVWWRKGKGREVGMGCRIWGRGSYKRGRVSEGFAKRGSLRQERKRGVKSPRKKLETGYPAATEPQSRAYTTSPHFLWAARCLGGKFSLHTQTSCSCHPDRPYPREPFPLTSSLFSPANTPSFRTSPPTPQPPFPRDSSPVFLSGKQEQKKNWGAGGGVQKFFEQSHLKPKRGGGVNYRTGKNQTQFRKNRPGRGGNR